MLKIVPKTSFKAKVPLSIPGNDRPAVVTLEFKHLNKKAMKEFFTGLEGKTDAEALSEVLLGWEDIDAPYSPESLETLLDNYPASAGEIFETYRQELLESRRKN